MTPLYIHSSSFLLIIEHISAPFFLDDVVNMLNSATEGSGLNRSGHHRHVESMVSSLFEWQTTFTFDEFRLKVPYTGVINYLAH